MKLPQIILYKKSFTDINFQLFISILPILSAFVATIYLAYFASGLPDNDYWDIFPTLLGPSGFQFSFDKFYHHSNEHIVLFPKFFYLLNFYLTKGNNFGLSIIAAFFSFITASILVIIISRRFTSRTDSLCLGMLVATMAFNPMAAHNFLFGMSGVAWLGANMFMIIASAFMLYGQTLESKPMIIMAVVSAIISGHFYSTGVIALTALGVQAFLHPKNRRMGLVIIALGVVFFVVVFFLQNKPLNHGPRVYNPISIASFILAFLGSGLTISKSWAIFLGSIGLFLFFVLFYHHVRHHRVNSQITAFWLAIIFFVLINASIAAISRFSMGGLAAAMASRYASLPSLFWISLLSLTLFITPTINTPSFDTSQIVKKISLVLCASCTALTVFINSHARITSLLERAQGKDLAALSLILDVTDTDLIKHTVTPAPNQLFSALPYLRNIAHFPFDYSEKYFYSKLNKVIDPNTLHNEGSLRCHVDTVVSLTGGLRLSGWALSLNETEPLVPKRYLESTRTRLAIIDSNNRVVGFGLGGYSRPDVAKAFNRQRDDYGWQGYIKNELLKSQSDGKVYIAFLESETCLWKKIPFPLTKNNIPITNL